MLGMLTAAAGLGAATYAGFQAFLPQSALYGDTFSGTPGHGRKLALTFDDGPNADCTRALLDVLAKHDVPATFFLIGKFVEQQPELARAIADAGHAVGNHTWSHPNLLFCPAAQVREEITRCDAALKAAGIEPARLFRPPWGARRPATLRIVRELGLTPVMWSVAGYDWLTSSAANVEEAITRRVRGGDVILAHDGNYRQPGFDKRYVVAATEKLIARFKREYEFVRVPEMMIPSSPRRHGDSGELEKKQFCPKY
jgi:peptidoglycan/xylan/chitin deacetylase (PgdA/CDA1 family)